MLLYAFYAIAFLCITNAILERHYNVHEEAIFADVIKNISRVNNVLQELISNYEQLQKIYKSQENMEDDYSSDTEIDEVFKSMKKAKLDYKKKNRVFSSTDRSYNADSFPATQMIWSDDDDGDDNTDDKSKDNEQAYAEKAPKLERLQKLKAKTNDDDFENSSSESMELYTNMTIPKAKGAKIIFIDTHKKVAAINENQKTSTVKPKNISTKKPKTRYNKVSKNDKTNKGKVDKSKAAKSDVKLRNGNDTKSIKSVVYSEKFSPKNIWKEIMKNKPIQLEPQKEISYEMSQKRTVDKPKAILRSAGGKTALVILTKNKQDAKDKDIFESPEDETIAKEIFKANVLRHAYGDACMKLVIRKCYKACKQAGKNYCLLYHCKSAFRSRFKLLSKKGCLRQFQGSTDNKTNVQYRGQEFPDEFVDATRGRYLDAACLPHIDIQSTYKPIILRNDTPKYPPYKMRPISKFDKAVNILRDKYETACKKESARKCLAACSYASSNVCAAYKCSSVKRKEFKKYCKNQCNLAYQVPVDSSESDTSESDSPSSSDTSTS